jgi:hypothetical protein
MRTAVASFAFLAFTACGGSDHGAPAGPDAPSGGEMPALDITSSDITLAPGMQVVYCYYFHTTNTTPLEIHKWVSDMSPGSHHFIFFSGGPEHADGLDTSGNCGFSFGGGASAQWTYGSQLSHDELELPTDDGEGKPLAQLIQPHSVGAFQMHYLNATDSTLTAHIELKGYAMAAGAPYTQTDPYVTYNQDLAIPPHADATANPPTAGSVWTGTCPTPPGAKFWWGSTHTHKQGVEADVYDGSTMLYQTTDWEHPTVQLWKTAPFYTYASNQVTFTCKYVNNGDNADTTLTPGNDAAHKEMCMMTGYYFPSQGPKFMPVYGGHCYSL